MMIQKDEKMPLTAEAVDVMSELCAETLTAFGSERKDVLRVRLALEEILEFWLDSLAGHTATFHTRFRLGKQYIEIAVEGPRVFASGSLPAMALGSRMLSQSGLMPMYNYHNGCNHLVFSVGSTWKISPMVQLLLAIAAALASGWLSLQLPDADREAILSITSPLFDTLVGCLKTVASPMIMLSIISGIINLGDMKTVSKIGSTIITRMFAGVFLGALFMELFCIPLFPFTLFGNTGGGEIGGLYKMILAVLPTDIITPFQQGNALQIVFLSVFIGLGLLVLGERVSLLRTFIEQLGDLINLAMGGVGRLMPVFIFLSLFNMVAGDVSQSAGGLLKIFGTAILSNALVMAVFFLMACLRLKVRPGVLAPKLLPTFLIALTTASSSASMSTNMETCERDLGIPRNIVQFAVPLGQVLFVPGLVFVFLATLMGLAETYSVPITPTWLLMAAIFSVLGSVATPPVPSGALGMCTILLTQLGIPMSGLAVALSVNSLLDPVLTGCDVFCLQVELAFAAEKLGLLNRDRLRSPKKS